MNHTPSQDPETGAQVNQPLQQSNNNSNNTTADATSDIVIPVEQTVPRMDSAPYVFPARRDNELNDSDRISINCDEEVQRPASPPFRPDPSPAFRYLGRSLRGDYTPSVRSALLPGHQQSSRPYSSSIRNEYHPPLGGDRPEGHAHSFRGDTGKSTVIDYAGLDVAVTEASLIESGFQKTTFAEPTINTHPDTKDMHGNESGRSRTLDRAASTGSSVLVGSTPAIGSPGSEFRRRSARKASFYSERAPRPPLPDTLRYTFYSKSSGFIQAPSMPQILSVASDQTENGSSAPAVFSDLLKDGCYWLDILDPSDFDMQMLAKHFHVHPLTIEDISTEEVREKYEVFRHYYFVCFRTFDQDYNSGSYLQPASMYSVVFRDGIITFHFRPTNHHINVLRRMEQMHSHITLTPDWINYALLDDITDSFASPIQTIQYEVDSIDELVLLLRESETTDMLRRIGSCRKNVMALSRLLSNKADVVRGLMKRFDERYAIAPLASSSVNITATTGHTGSSATALAAGGPATNTSTAKADEVGNTGGIIHSNYHRDGEIMLYLGDILDHVLTMLQSLWSYEKILDRSHSNYLAQISLEINQLSNQTNAVVGTLTFFASLIVPMTFISGLWGMNVHVPGQPGLDEEPLYWWWGILGFMLLYCIVAVFFGRRYGLI